MFKLTHHSLSFLLGLSAVAGMTYSVSAQDLTPETAIDPIQFALDLEKLSKSDLQLNDLNLQIKTIEQQATGQPTPGTTSTTVMALMPEEKAVTTQLALDDNSQLLVQNTTDPEIIFRHDYSYIGLAGNVGVKLEQTSLGEAGFVINGKVALAQELSLRPAVIFSDRDTVFLVPITYDITLKSSDPFKEIPFVPFIGGGAVFTTNDNDNAGFLVTGGVDWRMSKDFVANVALHTGFIEDSTDMGLVIGVGYIIPQKNK
jgi:hypothetical protein